MYNLPEVMTMQINRVIAQSANYGAHMAMIGTGALAL